MNNSKFFNFINFIFFFQFIKCVESLRRNQRFDIENYEQCVSKIQKYDDFLETNLEDLISQSQDLSIFEKVSTFHENDHHNDGASVSPHSQSKKRQSLFSLITSISSI